MTEETAEFYGQFNSIWLKNSIEMKMGKKSRKERHLKVKISRIKRKFENFTGTNCLNSSKNQRRKCRILRWIQLDLIEEFNRNEVGGKERHLKEKIWKIQRKFDNLRGKNWLNSGSNDRKKYRIFSTIEHNSIERCKSREKSAKKTRVKSEKLENWKKIR